MATTPAFRRRRWLLNSAELIHGHDHVALITGTRRRPVLDVSRKGGRHTNCLECLAGSFSGERPNGFFNSYVTIRGGRKQSSRRVRAASVTHCILGRRAISRRGKVTTRPKGAFIVDGFTNRRKITPSNILISAREKKIVPPFHCCKGIRKACSLIS